MTTHDTRQHRAATRDYLAAAWRADAEGFRAETLRQIAEARADARKRSSSVIIAAITERANAMQAALGLIEDGAFDTVAREPRLYVPMQGVAEMTAR